MVTVRTENGREKNHAAFLRGWRPVALPVPSKKMPTRAVRQATTVKRVPREGQRGKSGVSRFGLVFGYIVAVHRLYDL